MNIKKDKKVKMLRELLNIDDGVSNDYLSYVISKVEME